MANDNFDISILFIMVHDLLHWLILCQWSMVYNFIILYKQSYLITLSFILLIGNDLEEEEEEGKTSTAKDGGMYQSVPKIACLKWHVNTSQKSYFG